MFRVQVLDFRVFVDLGGDSFSFVGLTSNSFLETSDSLIQDSKICSVSG